MIQARAIHKRLGTQTVLEDLTFHAAPGQVTLLVGGNGVGKTTTLRVLSGLLRPDTGEAWINGRSIVSARIEAQRQMSFLPQSVAFHPRLTCRAVLKFYARLRGVPVARVDGMLRLAGLEKEARKPAGHLSGGLRQRLGLGVLLLPAAPVLLLDEPGLSLDPEWRSRLRDILRDEARRGRTVLVTTHLLAEWEGAADRCLHVRPGGRVTELDPSRLREHFDEIQTSGAMLRPDDGKSESRAAL
jgi:ABC-2 type transport system ATP-binding protein